MNSVILSIIAGLGGMFGWGASDFFGGLCSRNKGPFITLFWSQLAGLMLTLCLLLYFDTSINVQLSLFLLLPIAPVFYAAGLLFFYKGFKKGTISIIAASVNLWVVFAMIFAFIFLNQRLSTYQFFGAVMIIAGVTLASLKLRDIKVLNLDRSSGIKETILAALLFGIFFNISDVIVENLGWLPTTIFIKVGIIFYLLLISLVFKRKLGLSKTSLRIKLMVALVGVLEAAGSASVNFGFAVGDVILISPIAGALSIVTISMAIIFIKEKITKIQIVGILIAIFGISLTAF